MYGLMSLVEFSPSKFVKGVIIMVAISLYVVQVNSITTRNDNQNKSHGSCLEVYKSLSQEDLSRYIDASGKPGSGVYGGNNVWFGSFSECNKLSKSHYCLASFNAVFDIGANQTKVLNSLQWGACVPNVCSKENVKNNLRFFLKNVSRIAIEPMRGESLSLNIECTQRPKYTAGVVLTIIFCGIIIALCLVATILEKMAEYLKASEQSERGLDTDIISMESNTNEKTPLLDDKKPTEIPSNAKVSLYDILNCFSLIRNTNLILNTNVGKNDLTYLHGIRVLSLFWIILLHFGTSSIIGSDIPIDNPQDAKHDLTQRQQSMVFLYGAFAVDTFFVLSGLLVVYVNLIKIEKGSGKINWFQFYFHRFWRLTPLYMFVILLSTKIRPFIGDGPWLFKLRDTSGCSDYWWRNLLYINNFYSSPEKSCIRQTWFLAVDMQFYVLSPIFIIMYFRFGFRPLLGLSSLVALASMITTAILIETEDANSVITFPKLGRPLGGEPGMSHFTDEIYFKPYCRAQPYIVGVVLGCMVFKNMGRKFRLKWYWVLLLWTLSTVTALALIYSPYNAIKEDPHVWSLGEKMIYAGLKWFLWGLCIAWVIFACQYGHAGLIKSILSEKFWIPLSRINYAAFIVHFEIIHIVDWNIETPLHFTTYTLVTMFLGILVLVYATSYILTVVVELPFANLETLYLNRNKKR